MMTTNLVICALVAVAGLVSVEAAGRELLQDRVRNSRFPEVPRAERDSRFPEVPRAARRARGTQAPALPCDGDMCEPMWTKCAGKSFDTVAPCCEGTHCVMKNDFYSQCRPTDMAPPAGWDGEVLECGADSYGETGAGSGTYGM